MSEAEEIVKCINGYLEKELSYAKDIAILFSGGIDSTVLAKICKNKWECTLYTLCLPKSHDETWPSYVAEKLGMNHVIVKPSEGDIAESVKTIKTLFDDISPIGLSVESLVYLLMKNIKEEYIISGQGADEMFAGYNRYLVVSSNLDKILEKDKGILINSHIKWDLELAKRFNKKIIYPYLSTCLEDLKIPSTLKIKDGIRKYILREAAISLSIEKDIAYKEKKAAQYSSGMYRYIKKLTKIKP
ncbi:MAG: asparagine synthase C-terminal domain-containing protein [Thermoplasmata archaeon]